MRLKIQYILSYSLILVTTFFFIYSLGFMTDFFVLFMDGDDALYNYFKELQVLNNQLFFSILAGLIMALFLIGFDINKKRAGFFGVLYVFAVTIFIFINGGQVFASSNHFLELFQGLDFAILESSIPSTRPFQVTNILYAVIAFISFLLLCFTGWNYYEGLKNGASND